MATYTISAGCYDSILDTRRERTGHATVAEALASLADVVAQSADDLVTFEGDDDRVYVYRSQEDLDADQDGSSALATIERFEGPWRIVIPGHRGRRYDDIDLTGYDTEAAARGMAHDLPDDVRWSVVREEA